MVVQHNLTAKNANRYLGINNKKLSKSLEKLSSGYQINRAGDNAAGLAVSEKMRSQIAGMEQAVKNAQDGISMVQTFEGALTETDSILQRMKTLADQMANGSYDDPIDRVAAQQEFMQLNDELDQIADTDFNGVVVLNGGVMADGTKAVNGLFDYSKDIRTPGTLSKDDITLLSRQDWDDAGIADKVWKLFNPAWTRDGGDAAMGPDSVDITFGYSGITNNWGVVSASNGANVNVYADMDPDFVFMLTETGGFSFAARDGDILATVVVDQTKLVHGDTITLTFHNPAKAQMAPTNVAAKMIDSSSYTKGTVNPEDLDFTFSDTNILGNDEAMTAGMKEFLDMLNGAQIDITYGLGDPGTDDNGRPTPAAADGMVDTVTITFSDGTAAVLDAALGSGLYKYTSKSGEIFTIAVSMDNGVIEIFDPQYGNLMLISPASTANGDIVDGTGTISYKLGIEGYAYEDSKVPPFVEVGKTGSVSRSDAFRNSEAQLTYNDSITLQVGARTKDAVKFTFEYASTAIGDLKDDLNCTAKGLGTDLLNLNTQENANYAIDKIDQAINKVNLVRGTFGAIQNRLEHKIDNLNVSIENLTSAESLIRDTDMPAEMMNFTKNQILAQASQSMLAQANQLPQSILSLLQ